MRKTVSPHARNIARNKIDEGLFGKSAKNPHNPRKTINVERGTAEAIQHFQQNGIAVEKFFEKLNEEKNSLNFGANSEARKNFATNFLLNIGVESFSKTTLEMASRLLFYTEAHAKAMALRKKFSQIQAGQSRLDLDFKRAVEKE